MGFSNQWEQQYSEGKHMSIWPWSEMVSCFYRHIDKNVNIVLEIGCGAGANIPFFCRTI